MILRSISSFSRFASARFVLTVASRAVVVFGGPCDHVTPFDSWRKMGRKKMCAALARGPSSVLQNYISPRQPDNSMPLQLLLCPTLSRHLSELLTRLQRLISFRHNSSLILPHHTSMFFNRLSILALAATSIAGTSAQIQCQQDVLTCPDGTKYNRDPMNGVSEKSWDNVVLLAACVVFA